MPLWMTMMTAMGAGAEDRKGPGTGWERTRAPLCMYQRAFVRDLSSAAHWVYG